MNDTRPVYTLTSTPAVLVSREDALERARSLKPRLRERLPLGQQLRRLPEENVADILESGLFGVMKPKRYGGSELGTETMIDVTIELASADPSTGWVYMLWAAHMWMQSQWPVQAMDEMFENPNMLASSVVTTTGDVEEVEGGYRWTGKGLFSSGVDHCNWLTALVPIKRDGERLEGLYWVLLPREDFEIIDDWNTVGLRGTGSKTIVLDDVFIPAHRVVSAESVETGTAPGREVNTHPMYGAVSSANFTGAMSAPALGAARGFVEAVLAKHQAKASVVASTNNPYVGDGLSTTLARIGGFGGRDRRDARDVAARCAALRDDPGQGCGPGGAGTAAAQLRVHRPARPPRRERPLRGVRRIRAARILDAAATLA